MHWQVEQAVTTSVLSPIEQSLSEADSAPAKSDSPDTVSTPGSSKSRGGAGAGRSAALLGSALLARVDELVQKCSSTKASIKEMRARCPTHAPDSALPFRC